MVQSRGSFSPWGYAVNQRNGLWLHYTTFVELMAPTFSTRFFEEVARATLKGQYTGWGMDIIWPYLAGWPKDKIAVIDQVCMHHSPRKGRTGLYSIKLPMSERVEWSINLARFGLTEEKAKAAGVAFNKPMVISELSKDIVSILTLSFCNSLSNWHRCCFSMSSVECPNLGTNLVPNRKVAF